MLYYKNIAGKRIAESMVPQYVFTSHNLTQEHCSRNATTREV